MRYHPVFILRFAIIPVISWNAVAMNSLSRPALILCLSVLFLAACASKKPSVETGASVVAPPAEFKVHPELTGQTLPSKSRLTGNNAVEDSLPKAENGDSKGAPLRPE
jgi:hypothetical protein